MIDEVLNTVQKAFARVSEKLCKWVILKDKKRKENP